MNILWISHEYPPIGGGGATTCNALAHEFTSLHHKVTVVSAAYKDTPDFETVNNIEVYRLKCRRKAKDQSTFFEMLSFLFAAFRFAPKFAKERCIDIVYIFFGIPSGPLGWYLKKRFNIPYVICLGGGDIPGTQKRFTLAYALLGPALKAIWRSAVCVVANSHMLQERAMKYYSKARFATVNNGVNLRNFPAEKAHSTDSTFRLITTARIVERKGIQHVVEALPQLIKETGGNIRYIIIGDGPYRKQIETLAAKLKVSNYIEITGMLAYKDYLARLSDADVFVLTSHWEGMPNAVTEAMAYHLPVIMSDCEGSLELVDGNGFIVERTENMVTELTEKILILYNDRDLTAQMGKKSYERVCGHFRWEKSAAEFLKLSGMV